MSLHPQEPLKIAVVGTGHLGRIHAKLAAGLPEIDLVAVVDSCKEIRDSVAVEAGTRSVANLHELVGEIDAAIVATPTTTHTQVACQLLQAGIHVLIEKPLASSVAECEQIVQLARQQNLLVQVGHVERFNPGLTSVQNKLNDPKYIEAQRNSSFTLRSTDVGVVMDLMIHDIDIILSLVRSPLKSVEALGISVFGSHEDIVNARLKFESGCVAALTASRVSYQAQRVMQVFTSRNFAAIDFQSRTATLVEPNLAILHREFSLEGLSPENCEEFQQDLFSNTLVKQEFQEQEVNAIEQEQLDFATAIAKNHRPQVDGVDGRNAVAVAEHVLEQVDAHAWDGTTAGRRGPFAMPALPILSGTKSDGAAAWLREAPSLIRRKAG